MQATPWSLDEFVSHDVFMSDLSAPGDMPQAPAVDSASMEAEFAMRLEVERARIEADAYARGRADGERAARQMLDEQLAAALTALDEATQSVAMHEARWVGNAEENIAALAVSVARHIVQREIVVDPAIVAQLVSTAIAQYPVEQEITVRLSPDDLSLCRQIIEADLGGARLVRWIPDASIDRGGCLTEGRERIIDGRVDTALERIYRSLAGAQAS